MISIRKHCIPCSDFLSRLRKVEQIPDELESMEEKNCWRNCNQMLENY